MNGPSVKVPATTCVHVAPQVGVLSEQRQVPRGVDAVELADAGRAVVEEQPVVRAACLERARDDRRPGLAEPLVLLDEREVAGAVVAWSSAVPVERS